MQLNNRLMEIHTEMAIEQKEGRHPSQTNTPQQTQDGDEEWEQWDRLSLSDTVSFANASAGLRGSSLRQLSAVDDAERDLQLALDESLAHSLYEQGLREDEAEQSSRYNATVEREQLQAELAEQTRLRQALAAATSLAAQEQVILQLQQTRLADQRRLQQASDAAKALAAQQQQKLTEQRRQQAASDAAKVLAAQQQLRQQQHQQQQQQAQQQARLAAAEIQRQQLQSRLLQSQQQQSASAHASGYNVYTTNRCGPSLSVNTVLGKVP